MKYVSDLKIPTNKPSPPVNDELSAKAMGGTELMMHQLYSRVDNDLLDKFQIIPSRIRNIDEDKINLLWCHDLWNDPEVDRLKKEEFRKQFAKILFVSNWQQYGYNVGLGVPYSQSMIMQNAIEPIQIEDKSYNGVVNIIYHTTPHRGLNILVPTFEMLCEKYDNLHLDVYSSFSVYGWPERDEPYQDLFDKCNKHPSITYHGGVSNDTVRKALKTAHIFAYPSIWPETSCIAMIEAMSAKAVTVCPNYGALPETTAGHAIMYGWTEDLNDHATRFYTNLKHAIDGVMSQSDSYIAHIVNQKYHFDANFNWDLRAATWTSLLQGLYNEKMDGKTD